MIVLHVDLFIKNQVSGLVKVIIILTRLSFP